MPILGTIASSRQTATPDTGAMFPLQLITVGAANASSITFTNIPSTYAHLQLRCTTYGTSDLQDNYLTFNGVGGTSYVSHYLYGDGSGSGSGVLTGPSGSSIGVGKTASGVTTRAVSMVIDILDYANTNKNKSVRALHGDQAGGGGRVLIQSGAFLSNNAITSITMTPSAGSYAQYAKFALYGLKSA